MRQLRFNVLMAATTMMLFALALAINELLFARLEFVPGINWIYLPAGVRLLCTLLFAEAGAIGLLLVSWLVCFFHFFPNDPMRSFAGGILASAAPYLVYLGAQRWCGLQSTLSTLSPARLLCCAVAFSVASPLLHHLWFALYEHKGQLLDSLVAMVIGDLSGCLVVLYAFKWLLQRLPRQARQ